MDCWITVDFEDLLGQTIWTTTMQRQSSIPTLQLNLTLRETEKKI